MDANTLIFGTIAVISLAVFFYLGRFRASAKQRDRDDRIDWTSRRFSLWKIFLYSLLLVGGILLITQFV
jgi:putative copper export protein